MHKSLHLYLPIQWKFYVHTDKHIIVLKYLYILISTKFNLYIILILPFYVHIKY